MKLLNKGFTLIELMVAITIISIVSAYAVPSFQQSMVNNRLIGEVNNMYSMLSLARTEALRRNDYVSICPFNGTSCNGTDFTNGSVVYLDTTNAALATIPSKSSIIRYFDKFPNSSDKGKGITKFTFSPTGAVRTGTILICNPGFNSYSIIVNGDGSIVKKSNIGDGGC